MPWSLTVHGPYEFLRAERWRLGEKIASTAFTVCISEFCRSQCLMFVPIGAWLKLNIVRCGVDDRFLREPPTPVPDGAAGLCRAPVRGERARCSWSTPPRVSQRAGPS